MTQPFVVALVVEGHGEVEALPILLRRLVAEIAPERRADIRRPIRTARGKMLKKGEFERYVELAARQHQGRGAVLVLLDADDDCAATLGRELLERARGQRPATPLSVVVAVREFEAWFLAAAGSLAGQRGLPGDIEPPSEPEHVRDAKGWLTDRRTDRLSYSPTVDQPALAATFDLVTARDRSPSFQKLWRDVERLLRETR